MGRKSEESKKSSSTKPAKSALLPVKSKHVDATLDSLFTSSSGPVTLPKRQPIGSAKQTTTETASDDEELSEADSAERDALDDDDDVEEDDEVVPEDVEPVNDTHDRKRKRRDAGDDLEDRYMKRLVAEEEKERKAKKLKKSENESKAIAPLASDSDQSGSEDDEDAEDGEAQSSDEEESDEESEAGAIPQHESLKKGDENPEVEKASRTVFLGNVSSDAITSKQSKKELIRHLGSFFDALPTQDPPHKVESIRFRSVAFGSKLPKKAAFIKGELMGATTASTNAYAVYNTKVGALQAVKRLNGTVVLDRHLRVDSVAHPAKQDHKRCVFVGNLDFVDDDTQIKQDQNREKDPAKQKKRAPADVEEGLWREFGKAGTVESVRVVRDQQTRVSKGIAYVQFTDENAVEAALLFNDKKFPPLLPRKLRVTRARNIKRSELRGQQASRDPKDRTMSGRAGKLLGKAGAAQMRRSDKKGAKARAPRVTHTASDSALKEGIRRPEDFIFEGYRAQQKDGKTGLRLGGKKRGAKATPKKRITKRSTEWRKSAK